MNRITKAVRGIPRRLPAVDLTALARWFAALALLTIATFAPAASWDDDSHYVPVGPRSGYYIVRPGSRLSSQLGVEAAPTIDTADPFRHGYGADALAFHFNHADVLSTPPAYIVQATPNEFYTSRLGSLIPGAAALLATWKHSLAGHRISNADPMGSSPITRFRSTTRSKILEDDDNIETPWKTQSVVFKGGGTLTL
jgi:hypothetical protein